MPIRERIYHLAIMQLTTADFLHPTPCSAGNPPKYKQVWNSNFLQ